MTISTRWILPLAIACTPALACGADDDVSSGSASGAESGEDDAGLGEPGDLDGAQAPFAEACERLHDECAPVCDNVFVECYDDVATCTEQWTLDYLGDYDEPLIDPVRVAACAAQVDAQSCTDLEPDTVECEFAVVESCIGDSDAHGAVYSPFTPGVAQLDLPLDVHLCGGVREYFAITLEADMILELVQPDDTPGVFAELLSRATNAQGDAVLTTTSLSTPVSDTGEYLLGLDTGQTGNYTITIVRAP